MDIPHIGFIVAAYALATVAIVVMIATIWIDYRGLTARLGALQAGRADAGDDA